MTIHDALDLVVADYQLRNRRSIRDALVRIRHLRRLLPNRELEGLARGDLLIYASKRRNEDRGEGRGSGISNATINREIAVLRRGFMLAEVKWPRWEKLPESAPRAGFFSEGDVARVLGVLPAPERALVRFLYLTGWRKTEAMRLRWSDVNFERAEVHLKAGTTKSGEARTFPFNANLRALIEAQYEVRQGDFVFHRSGRPIRWFHDTWRRACREAGVPGKLLHDFRRTAARTMIERGIDRQVAMRLLGHKTESIFNRYRIVSDAELRAAVEKLS